MNKLISSAAIYILLSSYSLSQTGVTIFGKVSDSETLEPLAGVTILFFKDSLKTDHPFSGTAADNKGNYSLKNIRRGIYWLTASYIGYEEFKQRLDLSDETSFEFNFSLKPSHLSLEQILIEARRDTFRNISVIELSPDFVKTLPSISGEVDLYRALTHLPGVSRSSEISSGLYVRGGSPDQTLTLIDGVIAYNPFHLGGFATTFNTDAINDVRLIKGAFPAEYGGRLSSVLDITLKEGSKDAVKGKIGLGSISSRIALEGPISENASYLIAGRKLYLDVLMKGIKIDRNIPLYNFYDVNGKFNVKINPFDKITLSGLHGTDNLYSHEQSEDAGYEISWSNTTLNFNFLHLSSEKKFTLVSMHYTGYSFSTLIKDKDPDAFRNDFYSNSFINDYGLKIEGQYFSNEKHSVKSGADIVLHNFELINNNYFIPEIEKDNRFRTTFTSVELSGYLQDRWEAAPYLSANFGSRFYYFPNAKYFQVEPRVSATYNPVPNLYIKGAAAFANQFLHLIVRNDVILPTDIWFPSTHKILPGKSFQAVTGIEIETGDHEYIFSVEGYYKDMKNLYEYGDTAVFTIDAPLENQFTKGTGKAYGIEFFINKRIGSITGWIGYTLSWTRRFFDGINNGKPFYPRYDRRHDISLVLSYKLDESWEISGTWNYSSGQAFTMPIGLYYFPGVYSMNEGTPQVFLDYENINEYRLPSFHKLDLSASYNFLFLGYSSRLTLSVYNSYNRKNPFSRYISFNQDNSTKLIYPEIKQFTLFPIFPTLSLLIEY